jgi:hypothetical protein
VKDCPKSKDFGSFIFHENLVAADFINAAVKNQLNHTQPSTSFSVVFILNFIS